MIRRFTGTSLRAASALLLSVALLTGAALTAYGQAQSFNLTLDAFSIAGAPTSIRSGAPITFTARNAGPAGDTTARNTHTLSIEGPGGVVQPTAGRDLTGGQTGAFTFAALQPGNYVLFCPTAAGFHRTAGMAVNFTVVAGAAALPATGGYVVPAGLAVSGLATGIAGLFLRRRRA